MSLNQKNVYSFISKVPGMAKGFNWMKTDSQMASSAMLAILLHRVLADGVFFLS